MTGKISSWFLTLAAILTLCLLVPQQGKAQGVMVSFDSHDDQRGMIFLIDKELRDELGLFSEYAGFEQARLFRVSDAEYRLEVQVSLDGVTQKLSQIMDPSQVVILRSRISNMVMSERALHDQYESGRTHFIWTTALAAIGYYAPAISLVVDAEEADAAAASYLLAAGAGFFLPYFLTQSSYMTDGMAAGARVGAVLGIVHTGQLFGSFDFLDRASDDEMRMFLGISSLVSLAEMGAGVAAAKEFNIPEGRMNLIGVGGLLGTFGGNLWGNVILGNDLSPSQTGLFSIAGSIAGMYTANQLALNTHYTTGDAKALMMAGVAGAALAAGVLEMSELEPGEKLFSGVLAGAGFLSCLAAHRWLQPKDLRDAQGNYLVIGTTAGAILGTLVSRASAESRWEPELLSAGIGAAVGFITIASTTTPGVKSNSRGVDGPDDSHGSLNFNFNPGGAALALLGNDLGIGDAKHGRSNVMIASLSVNL